MISEISNAGHITLGDFHYDQLQLSQFTKTDKKDTTLDLAKRLGLVTVDRQFPVDNLRRVLLLRTGKGNLGDTIKTLVRLVGMGLETRFPFERPSAPPCPAGLVLV